MHTGVGSAVSQDGAGAAKDVDGVAAELEIAEPAIMPAANFGEFVMSGATSDYGVGKLGAAVW